MSKLVLYTGPGNATERVQWALAYKGVAFESRDATPLREQGTYTDINPFGFVPTLLIGERPVGESMAIVEYLEAAKPEPALFPGTLADQASAREICELINSTIHPAQNRSVLRFLRPELRDAGEIAALRRKWLVHSLGQLAPRLWQRGSFAAGAEFSAADIFVAVITKRAVTQGATLDELPRYADYMQFLFEQDACSRSAPFRWPLGS